MRKPAILIILILVLTACSQRREPIEINGVFPEMTVVGPHENMSESGIGALITWADKLWAIGYVAHIKGSRIGLYEFSEDMTMKKHPQSVTGTFANRMIHKPSLQAIIGPHFIDQDGKVRTSEELSGHRLTATMSHLTRPDSLVYFLTMEGLLFETNVYSLESKELFNLVDELDLPESAQPHFKGGFTGNGRVIVANNSYDEREYLGERQAGRLAEWDGRQWTIIEKNPFVEVNGKINSYGQTSVYGNPIFATGWDKRSVILMNYNDRTNSWKRYRLPKGSHSFDHTWNTEWMRIREAQTERFIMDVHGLFYELPMMTYGGEVWGIKPIAYHLRIVPDFCFWRGMFVMAGDQTDHGVGQPQTGLLFENIDDLWNYGKPKGWGAVWRKDTLEGESISDPFLMTGFDDKTLHVSQYSQGITRVTVQVDYLGDGSWEDYTSLTLLGKDYRFHVFPEGFSAHWVRLVVNQDCILTAQFTYN